MRRYAMLFLLVLLGIAFAESADESEIAVELSGQGDDDSISRFIFGSAIPIALIITYTLIAIAYMASKVFSSQELEVWSRIELREALISTMYAALIVSIIPGFNILIDSFGGSDSFVDASNKIIERSLDKLVALVSYSSAFSLMGSMGWTPMASFAGLIEYHIDSIYMSLYHNPFQPLFMFSTFTASFLPILFSAVMSVVGQFVLLKFLEQSLYVFIGLGLVLRAFAFTRRIGSTVIAIFLGGFIFLKLALAVEAGVFLEMGKESSEGVLGIPDMLVDPMAIPMLLPMTLGMYLMYNYDFIMLVTCGLFVLPCLAAGPWVAVCMASAWALCQFTVFPYIIYPIMYALMLIALMATLLSAIIQLMVAVGVAVGSIVTGPYLIAQLVSDTIATQIAVNSDLMAFAFFVPLFNIVFVLAGVKALVEVMGGDETVVNMLTFI